MNDFLDLSYLKKMTLLEEIERSKNSTLSRNDLALKLNVNKRTIPKLVASIEDDLKSFSFVGKLKIEFNNHLSLYTLKLTNDFSLQFLKMLYLENSIKFKILIRALNNELSTINQTANELFISPSDLRNKIKELQVFFSDKDINITTRGNIQITGNELSIRFFFTFLYYYTFQGSKWPFKFININQLTTLINKLPSDIYFSDSTDKNILLHYFMAVTILRIRKNMFISKIDLKAPLYESVSYYQKIEQQIFYKELLLSIPNTSKKNIALETSYIFSSVIAMGSYSKITRPSNFFFINKDLRDIGFLNRSLLLMDILSNHLIHPLDNNEYNIILYCIFSIHYRLLFLGHSLLLSFPVWESTNKSETIYNKQRHDLISKLVSQVFNLPELSELVPYKKYLHDQYVQVLEHQLSVHKYDPIIKITFLSRFSNQKLQYRIYESLYPYFNLKLIENTNEKVDLIISDTCLTLSRVNNIKNDGQIIYVNTPPTHNDLTKVLDTLHEIASDKVQAFIIETDSLNNIN